jgi:hypothetical protein
MPLAMLALDLSFSVTSTLISAGDSVEKGPSGRSGGRREEILEAFEAGEVVHESAFGITGPVTASDRDGCSLGSKARCALREIKPWPREHGAAWKARVPDVESR